MTAAKKMKSASSTPPALKVVTYQPMKKKYRRKGGSTKMYCPVKKKSVTAYQVPLGDIRYEGLNPARVNDCPPDNISQICDSLVHGDGGQEHPILLEWCSAREAWIPVYGCNRLRAAAQAYHGGDSIDGLDDGHIWSCEFTGTEQEKLEIQVIENFTAKLPEVEGKEKDLINLINRGIENGWIGEDETSVKDYINKNARTYAGRKFRGFWNTFSKQNHALQKKFKTWDKSELDFYFRSSSLAHKNFMDESIEIKKDPKKKGNHFISNESGYIVKSSDGKKKVALYLLTQTSEASGGLPTNATKKRHKKNDDGKTAADEVWVVAAINNRANSNTIETKRDALIKALGEWNAIIHTFDKVLFVPQTETEQTELRSIIKFVKVVELVK